MKTVNIKSGVTLNIVGRVVLPVGVWAIASSARKNTGTLVADLTSTLSEIVDAESKYTHIITLSADTTTWPEGNLLCDLRFSDEVSGNVIYSPTFTIAVEQSITNA